MQKWASSSIQQNKKKVVQSSCYLLAIEKKKTWTVSHKFILSWASESNYFNSLELCGIQRKWNYVSILKAIFKKIFMCV